MTRRECKKICTKECPQRNTDAMKDFCNVIPEYHGGAIPDLTPVFESVEALCAECPACEQ